MDWMNIRCALGEKWWEKKGRVSVKACQARCLGQVKPYGVHEGLICLLLSVNCTEPKRTRFAGVAPVAVRADAGVKWHAKRVHTQTAVLARLRFALIDVC